MNIQEAKEVLNRVNNAKRFDAIYTTIDIIFEAIVVLLNELDKKDKEIKYWKEQAEGYQGLAEQIKEDFENRDRWE